jgi:hypothetical protein
MEFPKASVRRVWRMTADCPMGEIVEVAGELPTPEPVKASAHVGEARDDVQTWLLDPAKVPNWQSSSFDLMTGLIVRDVSDTIPGRIFEEVFQSDRTLMRRRHF